MGGTTQQKAKKHTKGATAQSDTEPDGKTGAPNGMETLLRAIQQSLQDINGKLDTITQRVDNMVAKLDKHGERLVEAETRISTVEEESHTTTKKCAEMEKLLDVIKNKAEDFEARSCRNNIRIVGVPESTNTGKTETYKEEVIRNTFGTEHLSSVLLVERAHKSLASRPKPGAPRDRSSPAFLIIETAM